jgi:hypothetical protein
LAADPKHAGDRHRAFPRQFEVGKLQRTHRLIVGVSTITLPGTWLSASAIAFNVSFVFRFTSARPDRNRSLAINVDGLVAEILHRQTGLPALRRRSSLSRVVKCGGRALGTPAARWASTARP